MFWIDISARRRLSARQMRTFRPAQLIPRSRAIWLRSRSWKCNSMSNLRSASPSLSSTRRNSVHFSHCAIVLSVGGLMSAGSIASSGIGIQYLNLRRSSWATLSQTPNTKARSRSGWRTRPRSTSLNVRRNVSLRASSRTPRSKSRLRSLASTRGVKDKTNAVQVSESRCFNRVKYSVSKFMVVGGARK